MTALFLQNLHRFTGDTLRYLHPLNPRVVYTPGARCVAEEGGAYWLLDAIAIMLGSEEFAPAVERDQRIAHLHFWKLLVRSDLSAELIAFADLDVEPFHRQQIRFTDFPLPEVDIWAGFDGTRWTLYLPSEH